MYIALETRLTLLNVPDPVVHPDDLSCMARHGGDRQVLGQAVVVCLLRLVQEVPRIQNRMVTLLTTRTPKRNRRRRRCEHVGQKAKHWVRTWPRAETDLHDDFEPILG